MPSRYRGDKLMIDAVFGTDEDSEYARRKVREGLVDSVSIAFLGKRWETRKDIKTLVDGELLSVDLVSVPSNSDARILSARSLGLALREVTADARADALLALAAVEIAEAKMFLAAGCRGPQRRRVDSQIQSILTAPSRRSY